MPRTNNAIESWHSRLKADVKKEMTLNKLVNLLKEEQSKTDTTVMSLDLGNKKTRPVKSVVKDKNLYELCSKFDKKKISSFLTRVSVCLRLDLVVGKEVDSSESDSSSSDED